MILIGIALLVGGGYGAIRYDGTKGGISFLAALLGGAITVISALK